MLLLLARKFRHGANLHCLRIEFLRGENFRARLRVPRVLLDVIERLSAVKRVRKQVSLYEKDLSIHHLETKRMLVPSGDRRGFSRLHNTDIHTIIVYTASVMFDYLVVKMILS